MKAQKTKSSKAILLILVLGLGGFAIFKFSPSINLFFKFFTREGYLDERWDYEKVLMSNKSGYYMWEIGLKDGGITAHRVASGTTVTQVGNKELKMDFNSMEDYNNRGGSILFRNFIEKYNRENHEPPK